MQNKSIIFFNLSNINFEGGAEKYIINVGNKLIENKYKVIYLGQFYLFMHIFTLVNFLLGMNSFKDLTRLISNIKSQQFIDRTQIKFIVKKINWNIFLPLSYLRKEINKIIHKSHITFVKNEIIDMIFYFLFIKKTKKTFCIFFTSLYYPEEKNLRTKLHNLLYMSFIYRFLLKRYSGIIVSNKYDENYLKEKFLIHPNNIIYIPYGINYSQFIVNNNYKDFPVLEPKKRKILFAGRLDEQKGIFDLLNLIHDLNKKFNNYQFIIAGDGPLRSAVEAVSKIYKNVTYLGHLPHKEIISLMHQIDVVIILSKWETFCYVALEAQLCGKTVICYNIPGPNEIVTDDITGKIVQKNYKEIIKYLNNNYVFNVDNIATKYSIDKVINKYLTLINI